MTTDNFALASLPPELQGQALDLQRRQALTDALLAHSLQGSPQPTNPGRLASRMNPLQPLAQVFGAGMAGKASRDLSGQEVALGQRANQYMVDVLMKSQALRNGTPGTAGTPESAEDGLPSTPGTPATAGNDDVANALLMQHPATRGLGLEMMKRNMEMQAFKRAAGTSGSGGGGTGTSSPDGLPGFGSPAGGQPMEFWLQADPTGKAYLEQRAKDYTKSNDPVVNRGYGIGRMVNGKYVADPASLEQATGMEQAKADIAARYDQPITIKMSNQQELQLTRPEYRSWQETGRLPERYSVFDEKGQYGPRTGWTGKEPVGDFTGDPSQVATSLGGIKDPTERAAALRALNNQVTGNNTGTPRAPNIIGATQSQEDQIKQKGQTAAAEQIGQGLGKEAVATFSDGAQAVQANRQLDNMSQLATGFTPNRFQALKSTFAAYLNGIGMPESTVNSMLGTNVGDIRALTSQAVQLAGKLTRQSDSQPSQIQFLKNLQSMPNADMTAEGFQKVVGYMKDLNNYRIEKMIAQQQWLSSHSAGDVTGFEADWATKSKSLPFVWNQPQAKMPAPSAPVNEKPQVKAMPSAVPGAAPPPVGPRHVRPGETPPAVEPPLPEGVEPGIWRYMSPEERALWKK